MIEEQVWKTQIDLRFFQDLMDESNDDCDEYNRKSRYIKFKHNTCTTGSVDSQHSNMMAAAAVTGAEELDENSAGEQIFLETTV